MVTITVVLASVIGSTVLGLEDQAETAPTANFDASYDESADTVTVSHEGGQDILAANLYVRGESLASSDTGNWVDDASGEATGSMDGESAVMSGDSATVSVSGEEYVLRVIWRSPDTDMTAELAVERGPST